MFRNAPYWYRTFPRLSHTVLRIYGANYEREMELLDVLCDRSRTGIDIGAKVGMYTHRLLAHCADVIAFEPIPLFAHMLERVFEQRRCRVEPYALSNRRAPVTLRMPYRADGGPEFGRSTIEPANRLEHWRISSSVEQTVETRTLDGCRVQDVGFIKVDVEGHEIPVLDGAERTIASSRPNMLVECNDDHQPNGVAKLARWLTEHGYAGYFALGKTLLPIERFASGEHWQHHGVENFICIHRSRPETVQAVARRLNGHQAPR